jgi:hypothetical protein
MRRRNLFEWFKRGDGHPADHNDASLVGASRAPTNDNNVVLRDPLGERPAVDARTAWSSRHRAPRPALQADRQRCSEGALAPADVEDAPGVDVAQHPRRLPLTAAVPAVPHPVVGASGETHPSVRCPRRGGRLRCDPPAQVAAVSRRQPVDTGESADRRVSALAARETCSGSTTVTA